MSADPSQATGLAKVALITAVREMSGDEWSDQGEVAEAMAKASTLAERTCKDYLRAWAHFGLVSVDARYFKAKDQRHVRRPPKVRLTTLGRQWLDGQPWAA